MKLPSNLEQWLLIGARRAGSYDPAVLLATIGEHLTLAEHKAAEAFLIWLATTPKPGFGYATLKVRWAEWQKPRNQTAAGTPSVQPTGCQLTEQEQRAINGFLGKHWFQFAEEASQYLTTDELEDLEQKLSQGL